MRAARLPKSQLVLIGVARGDAGPVRLLGMPSSLSWSRSSVVYEPFARPLWRVSGLPAASQDATVAGSATGEVYQ